MDPLHAEKKQAQRRQALRQKRIEELVCRNADITAELQTLRSNNPNRRKYILMAGLATIFLYFLVIIFVVSLFISGGLYEMFTFFFGWTVLFAAAFIWLCFHIHKLRKIDKATEAQAAAYREELQKNNLEIATLQTGQ